MDQTFRPQEKGSVLTAEEVALLESLFQHNLKESPIDLAAYEKLAETDEDLRFVLNEMLTNCLNYTEDVARMERYAREHKGEYDDERADIDTIRARAHNATIDSINVFARVLGQKQQDISWLKWNNENRAAYGNFAILLTLNRFKEEVITRKIMEKIDLMGTEIDFNILKQNADAIELKIITYVEILSAILKEEDQESPKEALEKPKFRPLIEIQSELGKNEGEILGAFHQIYLKRYEQEKE